MDGKPVLLPPLATLEGETRHRKSTMSPPPSRRTMTTVCIVLILIPFRIIFSVDPSPSPPLPCDLYLAPSTIPNAGQGIFTGVSKEAGDTIGNGDKALPLIDFYWNNGDYYEFADPPPIDRDGKNVRMDRWNPHKRDDEEGQQKPRSQKTSPGQAGGDDNKVDEPNDDGNWSPRFYGGTIFNQFADYVWSGSEMGMDMESDHRDDITAFWPGLDALVNCNAALPNVEKATPIYDEAGLHRSTHPGAGSISPYDAGPSYVSRNIPAGGEIFKYYGDMWFITREDRFGQLPLIEDYIRILDLTMSLQNLITEIEENTYGVQRGKESLAAAIYQDVLMPIKRIWDSRRLNALHDFTWSDIERASEAGDMGILLQPNATRSVEWLNENGKCLDHIVKGPSTIPGAGQGAFAKRDLPKGTIVTGTPLLQVPDRDAFNMYDSKPVKWLNGQKVERRIIDTIIGHQIILNYCFGHEESSVLLCPDGNGVNYINHASSSRDVTPNSDSSTMTANVRVQWAKHGVTGQNDKWLQLSPDGMYEFGSHLALDYLALRDIAEGEELLLDYGEAWEKAWAKHVEAWWESDAVDADYMSAAQLNAQMELVPLRTKAEQEENPYPDNVKISCHLILVEDWDGPNVDPRSEVDPRLVWEHGDLGTPCDILSRKNEDGWDAYELSVRYTQLHQTGSRERSIIVHDVPRHGIRFVDAPHTTDLHLPQAFRHSIGIPDDIMPENWKNRRRKKGTIDAVSDEL